MTGISQFKHFQGMNAIATKLRRSGHRDDYVKTDVRGGQGPPLCLEKGPSLTKLIFFTSFSQSQQPGFE
jgi:hypothetical protein